MLVDFNWQPNNRQLRQFGFIALVALPALGWLWTGGHLTVVLVLAGVGVVLAGAAMAKPRALRPVFIGLSLIAAPIGIIVGEVVIVLIYLGLFLPIGAIFRLIGRDALQRKIDRACPSYWEDKPQANTVASYYRQW